jgi:hypothetical protein
VVAAAAIVKSLRAMVRAQDLDAIVRVREDPLDSDLITSLPVYHAYP